jgi:hypothetical protein
MAGYFSGATPIGVWLVGEIFFNGENSGQGLEFPNPGGAYDSKIEFSDTDKHEEYLSYFDSHGIKVFLQFEPGFADIEDLIDATYLQYGDHSSIIGFGIDVEWYQSECDGCENTAVSDATAQAWEEKVKEVDSNYRLFLKHYDKSFLPPGYRGDIIFIDDSEENGDYDTFKYEMGGFAEFFYPSDVMFQIGYESDKSWWKNLADPVPQTIGEALAAQTDQNCGIVWVDFTLNDVLPTD